MFALVHPIYDVMTLNQKKNGVMTNFNKSFLYILFSKSHCILTFLLEQVIFFSFQLLFKYSSLIGICLWCSLIFDQ